MGWTIDFDLSTVLLAALIWVCIALFLRCKRKKTFVYVLFFTIFYIYIIKLLDFTQFPIYLSESMRANIGQNVITNTNLVPFIHLGLNQLKTSLLNILLTIPFGFGLPFISNLNFKKVVCVGFLTSVTLEIMQLFTGLGAGFTFRIVDVNDVIFNTAGTALGYLFFIGFIRTIRMLLDKWSIEQNAILKYIYMRPQVPQDDNIHVRATEQ